MVTNWNVIKLFGSMQKARILGYTVIAWWHTALWHTDRQTHTGALRYSIVETVWTCVCLTDWHSALRRRKQTAVHAERRRNPARGGGRLGLLVVVADRRIPSTAGDVAADASSKSATFQYRRLDTANQFTRRSSARRHLRVNWEFFAAYKIPFTSIFICLHHPSPSAKSLLFSGCPSAVIIHSSISVDIVTSYHNISWTHWTVLTTLTDTDQQRAYWWPGKILEVKGQGHSRPSRWRRHPRRRCGVKVYLESSSFCYRAKLC